jgi:hypothetical protein
VLVTAEIFPKAAGHALMSLLRLDHSLLE